MSLEESTCSVSEKVMLRGERHMSAAAHPFLICRVSDIFMRIMGTLQGFVAGLSASYTNSHIKPNMQCYALTFLVLSILDDLFISGLLTKYAGI